MKRLLIAAAGLIAGAAAYNFAFTPWQRHWGATQSEIERPMPGDDIVPDANLVSTRAITVHAWPREIWPWLAQMGYQRGGLYSYDSLDMLFGIIDRPSSHIVLPQFQNIETGDIIPIGAGGNFYVHFAAANDCLVIRPEDRDIPVSWSTVLYPENGDTRLVTRVRVCSGRMPGGRLSMAALDFATFVMVRRWLQVLKDRAESLVPERESSAVRVA